MIKSSSNPREHTKAKTKHKTPTQFPWIPFSPLENRGPVLPAHAMEDHDRVLGGAEDVPDGTQHPESIPLMSPVPKNSATDKQRNIEIYTNCGSNCASELKCVTKMSSGSTTKNNINSEKSWQQISVPIQPNQNSNVIFGFSKSDDIRLHKCFWF